MKQKDTANVQWWQSLTFRASALLLISLALVASLGYWVINRQGRPQMNLASENMIERTGNEAVNGILGTISRVDGIARAAELLTGGMPKDTQLYMNTYYPMMNDSDHQIASGGIWFEPYGFQQNAERKALFWIRNNENVMQYDSQYEDINKVPDPYYKDAWYVPARYSNIDTCLWSKSYIDPASQVPMLTCTRPLKIKDEFEGVITVDLNLSSLQELTKQWQTITGGYVFLADLDNRFLTFPDEKLVKKSSGENIEEFIYAEDLSKTQPLFVPIANTLKSINDKLIEQARKIDNQFIQTVSSKITSETNKISPADAQMIAAIMLNTRAMNTQSDETYMVDKITIENDFYLNQPATAYFFKIPYTYWKMVVVKPISETNALANSLSNTLIKYMSVGLIATTIAGLLLFYLLFGVPLSNTANAVRSLTGMINDRRFDDLQENKFSEKNRSEIGVMGQAMNQLIDTLSDTNQKLELEVSERTLAQQKAEQENEQLNNSVINILQAVNQLSQRDLTAKAPVTEDIIGTVADSINALTDETSRVLLGVTDIAGQVADVSGKVKSQADQVTQTAEEERESVNRMVESLFEATQTMNQVAALAEQSNLSAEEATEVTDGALETVTGTVREMDSIRETIAETEKRIKRLGERSQEISSIVNLINTISERTHVLALNASMQAAVAGEAGRGFAVVAEEVQRLAESSRNATEQIGTLVNNIQVETNETINTVNRTIAQVVQGSDQAQKAGEQMRRTQEITARLVNQVRSIANASEQQKAMSAQLLEAVQRIGESTENTAQQIVAQNQETDTLLDASRRLVESVSVFKLPQTA